MRVLYREAVLRELDSGSRVAEFVAATENAVDTAYGREVLRMSGCDLARYERNPVLLDSHRRESCSDVVGRGEVRIEGAEMIVRAHYLDDEDGERVWRKVQAGAVRAVSIGYAINPERVRRLREGERDGDVTGPALIVDEWELLEVSNVPVPADAAAVRRELYRSLSQPSADQARSTPEARMADSDEAQAEAERMDDDHEDEREEAGDEKREECECEDDEDECDCSERMDDEQEERMDDEERSAPARAAKAREAFVRAAPESLRDLAEDVFLDAHEDKGKRSQSQVWATAYAIAPSWAREAQEGRFSVLDEAIRAQPLASLADYRAVLIAARNERCKPVGSGSRAPASSTPDSPSAKATEGPARSSFRAGLLTGVMQ